MEQVQRQALPSFMQERMAALESAGYAVQETCRDNDRYTAGMENQQGRVLVIVGKAETGGRHGELNVFFERGGWRALISKLQAKMKGLTNNGKDNENA